MSDEEIYDMLRQLVPQRDEGLANGPPPASSHLGDETFVGYAMDLLAPDEVAAADEHLGGCEECAERLERLLIVSESWCGAGAERRLEELSTRSIDAFSAAAAGCTEGDRRHFAWLLTALRPLRQPRVVAVAFATAAVAILAVAVVILSTRTPPVPQAVQRTQVPAAEQETPPENALAGGSASDGQAVAQSTDDMSASPQRRPLERNPVASAPGTSRAEPSIAASPEIPAQPAPASTPAPRAANASASPGADSPDRAVPSTPDGVAAPPGTASADANSAEPGGRLNVDAVIAFVQAGLSEEAVIEMVRAENRPFQLSPADVLKLANAGVGSAIISAMASPGAAPATVLAASLSPEATPFPPDLPDAPGPRKRVVVSTFDDSYVTNWVQYWFKQPYSVGDGTRAMLLARLVQSNAILPLEREKLDQVVKEQGIGAAIATDPLAAARFAQLTGADYNLEAEIVVFGRDDTRRRMGIGAGVVGRLFGGVAGGAVTGFARSDRAEVAIDLRLVDPATGQTIETASVRGESSRASADYADGRGGAGAASLTNDMTSAEFQQTIIGEATANAVARAAEYLEARLRQLPARPRVIEGRLTELEAGRATLALGALDGVVRGDRFEILQINGIVRDPRSKEALDIDATKVGELVVDTVLDRTAAGAYGGLPLSPEHAKAADKGYAARLMSR